MKNDEYIIKYKANWQQGKAGARPRPPMEFSIVGAVPTIENIGSRTGRKSRGPKGRPVLCITRRTRVKSTGLHRPNAAFGRLRVTAPQSGARAFRARNAFPALPPCRPPTEDRSPMIHPDAPCSSPNVYL